MRRILLGVLCGLCVLRFDPSAAQQQQPSNSWSDADYAFYAGDFNGDGYTDILFVSRNPGLPSGILLSDGTAPTILNQTWASNYLGISWSPDTYTVVLGDFNGDGKTDIFLQSTGPGDSYLLLTDASGKITAISQTVPAQAMGLAWTADQHHLVAGDFGGTGRAGLFFQPTAPGGISAVVYPDANGQFTSATPAQTWADGYLGFNWSVQQGYVYAGDFNGDGRADLLIQAQPVWDVANATVSFSYPPNMNGVVLSAGGAQPFGLTGLQSWSRNTFGVDWSPLTNNLIIGDFNGDGRSDVLLQPVSAGGSAYLLFGQANGPVFSTATGPLPTDTPISADVATLVAGKFGGSGSAGLLIQSISREGTNAIAKNISKGVHPGTLALPTLSASSVSMAGIQYPPSGSASSTTAKTQSAQPLAATIAPTSAGRTAGQFSVTPTGAATYNIPLWTPPGARGVEPHLALHYTSGGPDGPMGPGWSLAGLSAIVRCGKTWASSSGAPAGVTLSASDDICLDGNRLRLTSGNPLQAGSTYQTEIADFSLVTAYGTQGNGPQYFFVQGKDGRTYEYGNTADSRIFASGATTPYAWALNKVRDRQSNNMTFTYVSGATALTLSKIQYTTTVGSAAPYEVDFTYVTRVGGDSITQYIAGGLVSRTTQLDNVNVLSSGTTVRKYQLGYQASPTTNRAMLQTLQECGGSAGTDCIRPTTITYQSGQAGWSTTPVSTGQTVPSGAPIFPIDVNGDGITDLVYAQTGGSGYQWYVRYGSTSGTFSAAVYTGVTTKTTDPVLPADLTGHGQTDLLYPSGSTWWRLYWNGSALATANTNVNVPTTTYSLAQTAVADVNGDGLPDLIYPVDDGQGDVQIYIQLNTTTPGGALNFGTATLGYTKRALGFDTYFLDGGTGLYGGTTGSPFRIADFNGDGRADLLMHVGDHYVNEGTHQSATYYHWVELISSGGGFVAGGDLVFSTESSWAVTVDWNGDGCTDLIVSDHDLPGFNWAVYLSGCNSALPTSFDTGVPSTQAIESVDWDGDGRLDLLTTNGTGNWQAYRSTGTGIGAPVDTGLPPTVAFFAGDFNGDGQSDLGFIDTSSTIEYFPHKAFDTPPDLAMSISDGFGINFSPTYVPISQYNYVKCTTGVSGCTLATFPEIDFQGPMYVVNQFSASDGTGGTYTNDFYYWYARLNLQGRGFEGFNAARQHDSRSGIYVLSYYLQQFPYIGSLSDQETIESDAVHYMGITGNTYANSTPGGLSGTSCSSCYFPYISQSIVYNFEPDTPKWGGASSYISYTNTQYTYDSYGNLTDTLATTTDTDSTSPVSPFNGQSWVTEIKNTISNDNSTANWCLGRPSNTTTQKIVPGPTSQTRTVSHTIDYQYCRATVETVEPNDSRLKVTTTFAFDNCGNTSSVSVVGLDQNGNPMPQRVTTTNYSYTTPQRCALPETVTNADGTTVTAYNYSFGLPSSVTDPNGIQTSQSFYDDFGRKTKEVRADGTYTTIGYSDCVPTQQQPNCWGYPDLRFLTTLTLYNSAGTSLRSQEKFTDGLDRLRFDEGNRVLGAVDSAVYHYNNLGLKTEFDLPTSASSNGYHLYTYDVGNRLTEDDLYTNAGTCYRSIKIGYAGQTTTVTAPDPNGSANCSNGGVAITKVTDVAGKIRQVTDPNTNGTAAGTTYYTFDPFGNLSKIVDADSVPSTYTYNIRGFKTASSDADAGAWTFTPDSLNELVSQTDAKSQTTSFGYDLLGRMTSRTEPESTTPTQWVYGTSKTAYNIGRIVSVSKPDGYGEGYTYDSAGRPQTVTYTEDSVNYPFTYAYNNQGTVDTLTYPISTSGYQFVLKYVYDSYGFLNETKDNAAGTVFWQLNTASDASLPTLETLGNTVQVATSYTPWTNEMVTRTEGSGGSTTNLQNLSYNWDAAGNLHQRIDNRQSLTEQFGYDSMNRLLSSTLNGSNNLTMTYDAAGNIATKSDVSSSAYVYDTGHPHAVKTAGSWSMSYDANGNMITRAGGSITWYSYDLPNTISYSGNSTQFFYNASHRRWKQVASYSGTAETTHYIGGMLEIMTRGTNPTEYRHQIPAGSAMAVYTRRTDGSTSTYYATSDHLGSSDLVIDSSANVLTRESFTPFGARRGSAWTGTPTSSDYTAFGNTTRKGFTGHEMLDSVALVHMNGRVYDPYLGRFLSADTLIANLVATQSVNPYSYAWNDPLKYIDPSGHGFLDAFFGIVIGVIAFFSFQYELVGLSPFWTGVIAAGAAGFIGGFTGALLATGSMSAALTAGLVAGITGAAFGAVGYYADAPGSNWGITDKVLAHAAVGCFSGVLASGNCGKGALTAAVSEYLGSQVLHGNEGGFWGKTFQMVKYALIGGITSKLEHESFDEGFSLAAAGYLFNDLGDQASQQQKQGYNTAADAARAALAAVNPESIQENVEYAGLIFQYPDGSYGFTAPITSNYPDGVNPYNAHEPRGTTIVGDYHTHGDYSVQIFGPWEKGGEIVRSGNPKQDDLNSDNFSTDDMLRSNRLSIGRPGYQSFLGTPSGVFKVYNPSTGIPSNL